MRWNSAPALGVAVLLLLGGPMPARAELVNWTYTWSAVPDVVAADAPGTGKIFLDQQATGSVTVSTEHPETDIVATNITTYSEASPGTPDTFTNAPFELTLEIKDTASGNKGLLTFRGVFNGKLTAASSKVHPTMDAADVEQSIPLGNYLYTVTLTTVVNPGPPTTSNKGSIGAKAAVEVRPLVQHAPEPGSLVLGALGVGAFWLRLSRRRPALSF